MLILNPTDLSPYAGEAIAYGAIASSPVVTPVDTLPLGQPSASVQPVILSVTSGGSGEQTFTAPVGTLRADRILYGTESYSPAVDPTNLQPGEFVFNSLSLQITVSPKTTLQPGRSLLVQTVDPNAVLTEYLLTANDSLPDIFFRYNLTGAVAWSCGWEENPSGAFELITDWATADALENELIPKVTELEIFGVGFQVDSLTITKRSPLENPNLEARVQVQLRGKWEKHLEEQVVIDAANGVAGGARTIRGNTTVQAIAAKVGAVAVLPVNRIEAPRQSGEEQILSLQEVFEGNLRHNGCFARYSRADAIAAVRLDAVQVHNVSYSDLFNPVLEIQVNANPRALDFKNGRLEWGNNTPVSSTFGEDTQANAAEHLITRWRQKPVDRQVVTTGSPNLDPPSDIKDSLDSSLAFDSGGPIKEQTTTTTENGAIVRQQYVKFGFAVVACDHLYYSTTENNRKVWKRSSPNINSLWQQVEAWEADYIYEPDSGYLRQIAIRGTRLGRYQSEGSNESLDAWSAWDKAAAAKKEGALKKLDSYRYKVLPVYEASAFQVMQFRQYYGDIPPRPTEENELFVPEFNPDGSLNENRLSVGFGASTVTREDVNGQPWLRIKYQVPVPGWTEPSFCAVELNRKLSFMRTSNPDSTDKKPLPDLTAGEDRELERRTFTPDYRYQERTGTYQGETFIEYSRLQAQRDAGFSRSARETTEDQQKGRPSEHTRKETFFEKIDPTEGEQEPDEWEYVISTTDYEDDRVVGETASYPYASTFDQAILGLQTDLEITNTRDTKTTSVELRHTLAMQEGDRVNLEGHGQWRVLGYSKSLAILAPGVIQPGRTVLELGKVIQAPAIAVEKKRKPTPPTDTGTTSSGSVPSDPGALLGPRISRGNLNGT